MKAREFLAQKKIDASLRDLLKQPLTVPELKKLAARAGGVANLVAPKRRKEAEGIEGDALLAWLAADGGRVRRPIVDLGDGELTLGFAADARETLEARLKKTRR